MPYQTPGTEKEPTFMKCSKCGSTMEKIRGPFGLYYGCSSFRCNTTSGSYSFPEEVALIVLAMNDAFSSYIRSYLFEKPDLQVSIAFMNKSISVDEKTPGFIRFTEDGFEIRMNQYYHFRTKFDILEFLVKKYVIGWKILSMELFAFKRCCNLYPDEAAYMRSLDVKAKKVFYGSTAVESSGIIDTVFDHVFGVMSFKTDVPKKKDEDFTDYLF